MCSRQPRAAVHVCQRVRLHLLLRAKERTLTMLLSVVRAELDMLVASFGALCTWSAVSLVCARLSVLACLRSLRCACLGTPARAALPAVREAGHDGDDRDTQTL